MELTCIPPGIWKQNKANDAWAIDSSGRSWSWYDFESQLLQYPDCISRVEVRLSFSSNGFLHRVFRWVVITIMKNSPSVSLDPFWAAVILDMPHGLNNIIPAD